MTPCLDFLPVLVLPNSATALCRGAANLENLPQTAGNNWQSQEKTAGLRLSWVMAN